MTSLAYTFAGWLGRLTTRADTRRNVVVFTPQPSRDEPGTWALIADRLAVEDDKPGICAALDHFETPIRTTDQYAAWALAVLLQAEPEISQRLYALCCATRIARHLDYGSAIQEIVEALRADPRYAQMIASTQTGIRYGELRALAVRRPLAA